MRKEILTAFALASIVSFSGCKKQGQPSNDVRLQSLEYRIVVTDTNIKDIGLDARAVDNRTKVVAYKYHQFQSVSPSDTLVLKIESGPGIELLQSTRQLQLMVHYKNKVYSPLLASEGVIVEGNPYQVGWHYTRWYNLLQADTVKTQSEQIYYIRLPADTSKFSEF